VCLSRKLVGEKSQVGCARATRWGGGGLQRRLAEVCMHHESRHRVSDGICEGHTHDKEAGKVTPASDVIALL
jgi:hypothetical protein